jgi:hypothetical protein
MGPHRLVVRTPAFQAGDTGSNPVGDTIFRLAGAADESTCRAGGAFCCRKIDLLARSFLRRDLDNPKLTLLLGGKTAESVEVVIPRC